MIALVIVPLRWADPASRRVLVPDESKPSERFAGEDEEGFYSIVQAKSEWESPRAFLSPWRYWLSPYVVPCDLPLYSVACIGDALMGVYVEHFSAPTDATDFFEDAPMPAHQPIE